MFPIRLGNKTLTVYNCLKVDQGRQLEGGRHPAEPKGVSWVVGGSYGRSCSLPWLGVGDRSVAIVLKQVPRPHWATRHCESCIGLLVLLMSKGPGGMCSESGLSGVRK